MPKQVEEKLRREAQHKFPGNKKRQNAYILGHYGNLDGSGKDETDGLDGIEQHRIVSGDYRSYRNRGTRRINFCI